MFRFDNGYLAIESEICRCSLTDLCASRKEKEPNRTAEGVTRRLKIFETGKKDNRRGQKTIKGELFQREITGAIRKW